ncbi:hypothetical protein [Ancylobacter radicis]|uniref:Uncharacterized protein n=1 Tax=Ancylobacter radicis TaxID=2836179 RepID=A0ABS5RB04_9HYPH|nr:hypothetical protein [Ancylobacter radicis]MBS9478292.1 hypothetical protein [Ancylobacter radicis]
MQPTETYSALIPPLKLRDGDTLADIATLDEALAFAEAHPHPRGDYEGLIRRLQSASETADRIEAGNAFKWWAEANGILVEGAGLPE